MKRYASLLIALIAILAALLLGGCTLSECEKNGHTEVIDSAVAATCTATGLTEGKHCSVCNAVLVAQTETPVDPNAHTVQNGICTGCKKSFISEGLSLTLIDDSYYEVSGIGTCTDTEIYIPAEYNGLPVKSIGSSAFEGCSSLKNITLPDSVTNIGGAAFWDCSSLTSTIIPDSVTSIGVATLSSCSSLTDITVAEGNPIYHSNGNCLIETASKTLIAGCSASVIPTDGSVTSIGFGAFYECSSLTSITIPNSVTSIGYFAFSGCSSLTSITVPDSVTSIGREAFYDCSSLTSITIPDSVTGIGNGAFSNCDSLTNITFTGTQEQ